MLATIPASIRRESTAYGVKVQELRVKMVKQQNMNTTPLAVTIKLRTIESLFHTLLK